MNGFAGHRPSGNNQWDHDLQTNLHGSPQQRRKPASACPLPATTNAYDELGRLTDTWTESGAAHCAAASTTYTYDELGRLTDTWTESGAAHCAAG